MATNAGILTAVIALIAVIIAAGQWHTARSKLVLDLFEKRLEVYDGLRAVIAPVVLHGKTDMRLMFEFRQSSERARLLFGDDVVVYLGTIEVAFRDLYLSEHRLKDYQTTEQYNAAVEQENRALTAITTWGSDFAKLAAPYMRMDAKLPGWPFFNL